MSKLEAENNELEYSFKSLKKKVQWYQKKAHDLQGRLEKTEPGMNQLLVRHEQLMCQRCRPMVEDALKNYPGIDWSKPPPKLEL